MTDAPQNNPAENTGGLKRVLLVDDNEGNLMAMTLLLKREKMEPETAEDGAAAIERLGEKSFDLLLSDVDMPNIGGFELLDWVRIHRPEMPVLLMSGSASGPAGHTARLAFERGARGILSKPFVAGELERVIADIFR